MSMDASAGTSFLGALAALFGWTTLYFTLCLQQKQKSYEWNCRTVTFIHAVIVTSLSALCGFVQGPWPFTDPGGPNTPLQRLTVTLCLGYFIFDFLWCLYFRTEGIVMLFHHILSLFGNSFVLYTGKSGTEMIAAIFGSEMTNPLLQTRWFLRQTGHNGLWYGILNDLAFVALFTFLRVGVGTRLLYCYLRHPQPTIVTKVGGVLFYVVSWIWCIAILRYAKRKYTKMYTDWKIKTWKTLDKLYMNGECTQNPDFSVNDKFSTRLDQNGHSGSENNGYISEGSKKDN